MTSQLEIQWPESKRDAPQADGVRRPTPPPGYVFFKWRRKNGNLACPECGRFGFCWNGGGWTDPRAQRAFEEGEAKGIILCGAGDPKISCDRTPILMHWSRYGVGNCMSCDLSYWHDFGGGLRSDWHYYYKPTRGTKNAKPHAHQRR